MSKAGIIAHHAGMRTEVYEQLSKKLLEHLGNNTTDSAASPMAIPVSNYTDPERWQREVKHIFREMPVLVALTCDLTEPGSYRALDITGVPILITRAEDGKARAFLNVCRHRGAHVADPGQGKRGRFVCPYHGWSYDACGKLIQVADSHKFGELPPGRQNLVELYTEEAAGLIFTCLTPGRTFDLLEYLGDMYDELASFHLEDWHLMHRNTLEGPNWKVAMDGYIEFYHIAAMHRDTLSQMVVNNVMVCDAWGGHEFGPHQRVAAPSRDIQTKLARPKSDWITGEVVLDVKFVFPNNAFAITAGNPLTPAGGLLSQVFPGPTPDTCFTIMNHIYQSLPANEQQRELIDQTIAMFKHVVPEEDYKAGRQIQLGMNSAANDVFTFGKNELSLQRFHTALDFYLENAGC